MLRSPAISTTNLMGVWSNLVPGLNTKKFATVNPYMFPEIDYKKVSEVPRDKVKSFYCDLFTPPSFGKYVRSVKKPDSFCILTHAEFPYGYRGEDTETNDPDSKVEMLYFTDGQNSLPKELVPEIAEGLRMAATKWEKELGIPFVVCSGGVFVHTDEHGQRFVTNSHIMSSSTRSVVVDKLRAGDHDNYAVPLRQHPQPPLTTADKSPTKTDAPLKAATAPSGATAAHPDPKSDELLITVQELDGTTSYVYTTVEMCVDLCVKEVDLSTGAKKIVVLGPGHGTPYASFWKPAPIVIIANSRNSGANSGIWRYNDGTVEQVGDAPKANLFDRILQSMYAWLYSNSTRPDPGQGQKSDAAMVRVTIPKILIIDGVRIQDLGQIAVPTSDEDWMKKLPPSDVKRRDTKL